ncbi:MAG: hypothetical protein OSA84_13410, partial [Akkermansiaceae bacterium]|nr:hypothetical protein [Akkermansiaceae bacterium]
PTKHWLDPAGSSNARAVQIQTKLTRTARNLIPRTCRQIGRNATRSTQRRGAGQLVEELT